MSVQERLENVERILLLKYGTLDYDTIKKRHDESAAKWKDMAERSKKLREETEKMRLEQKKSSETVDKALSDSLERLEEARNSLKVATSEDETK